jgi:hypothetical protein
MEFYVNFGQPGLLLGYTVLGTLLRLLDFIAGRNLYVGATEKFVFWFVAAQSFLFVGGNFAEMTGAAAGYAVLCTVVNRLLPSGRRLVLPQLRPDLSSTGPKHPGSPQRQRVSWSIPQELQ